MANNLSFLFFYSTFFFFLLRLVSSHPNTCSSKSCGRGQLTIRFPFGLKQFQPEERCMYPGFDLSCDGQRNTTLNIPLSGEFIVDSIDYARQVIRIRDPDDCLLKRLHNFTTLASNWTVQQHTRFSFFKCLMKSRALNKFMHVPCLDGKDYYVVIVATADLSRKTIRLLGKLNCSNSRTFSIPTADGASPPYETFDLTWSEPSNCTHCEVRGDTCGFKGKKGLETRCIAPHRHHDQWIIMGISIPCFVFITSLIAHILRARRLPQQDQTDPSSPIGQAQTFVSISGMDTPTIELYPKTCVGEAGGSMPQDNNCSICLLEYKSKEVLRTLPECKHSFHAHCIDPWLKRNASCPLCRNDQGSAMSMVLTQGEDTSYVDYTIGN